MPYEVTEDGTSVIRVHGYTESQILGEDVEVPVTSAAVYNKGDIIDFDVLPLQLETSNRLREISADEVPVADEPEVVEEEAPEEKSGPQSKGRVSVKEEKQALKSTRTSRKSTKDEE